MSNGRILVGLLLLIGGVGTLVSGSPVYVRFLYLGLLLILAAWLWTRVSLRRLTAQRQARALRASLGDVFEEHYEIHNQGRLPCLWVEVGNRAEMPGAAGSRLLTNIGGRQKRTYAARTWLVRRGGFSLGPTVLTAGDPFGLFQAQRTFPAEETLVVLPQIHPLTSFYQPPGLLPGGKVIQRKSLDITPHAAGVREYVPGDPMKRIHWPTSARRGQMMVKEFEQDPQAEVWIYLDAQDRPQAEKRYELPLEQADGWLFGRKPKYVMPPSTFEYAASIAASLAHYFLEQRRAVGFAAVSQTQTIIQPDRSDRQEDKILETLAFLEPRGKTPLANLVQSQAATLPQGSSVILITPTTRNELVVSVDSLQRRGLRPLVILLMADTFGGMGGGDALVNALTERRVPVLPVYCDADLSQTLSGFTAEIHSREVSTWTRPPFIPST